MMWRATRILAVAAAVVLAVAGEAAAQTREPAESAIRPDGPLLTTDRLLEASLLRISRGSLTWRAAMDTVHQTGRRVLVVTPGDRIARTASDGRERETFGSGGLAEIVPAVGKDSQIRFVVVIVNLPLVQRLHDAKISPPRDFEADLDRILVHEIYGHAVPYLLAGTLSGRCADPQEGERAADACSIRRENAVRAELGLGRRTDSGLYSLALARGAAF
jgi:hypothetical protein